MPVHTEDYCRDIKNGKFVEYLKDSEKALMESSIKALKNMYEKKLITYTDKEKAKNELLSAKREIIHCVSHAVDDIHMIKLRQNPPYPSSFKVVGLFIKHLMDHLPLKCEDASHKRKLNALYAISIALK